MTPPTLEPRRPRPPDEPSASSAATSCFCPNCGTAVAVNAAAAVAEPDAAALLRQARQQIQDLQAQVARLDQKAAAAIDRWADYEDELTGLRRQLNAARNNPASADAAATTPPSTVTSSSGGGGTDVSSPTRPSFLPVGAANRLSALLSPRGAKSTPNLKAAAAADASAVPTPPPPARNNSTDSGNRHLPHGHPAAASLAAAFSPSPPQQPAADSAPQQSTKDLLQALTREQALRRAAEGRLQDTSREVEELSVSLFEQANEMVADERRARARLEARVATLEQRDTDKRRRLERLEQAMDRIARVRALLGEQVPSAGAARARTAAAEQRLASSSHAGVAAPAVAVA